MPSARLIVCETTSKWAVALRRQMCLATDPRLHETRSLEDCWAQAVAHPASFVAVEATVANLERLLEFLQRCRIKLPRVRTVVLGSRHVADFQWLWREAGAIHVVFSSRAVASVVRVIRRHWRAVSAHEAQAAKPVWNRLPWGDEWLTQASPRPAWLCDEIES